MLHRMLIIINIVLQTNNTRIIHNSFTPIAKDNKKIQMNALNSLKHITTDSSQQISTSNAVFGATWTTTPCRQSTPPLFPSRLLYY